MKTMIVVLALIFPALAMASPLQWPDTVATRQDVQNLMQVYPERTKAFLKRLARAPAPWVVDRVLSPEEFGAESSTRTVSTAKDETTGEVTRTQMRRVRDPRDYLGRLGIAPVAAEAGLIEETIVEVVK